MAEPFVFHFKPAPDGRPLLMYIADLSCVCSLCKHPQIQRFYHATDFHTFTLRRLDELADQTPAKAGYECENCGEDAGLEDVVKTTVTVGYPDEAGLLRVFTDLESGERRYQLVERKRLDPQELPGFEPIQALPIYDELTDDLVEERLGRCTNLKIAWRELLDDFAEYGDEAWSHFGQGMIAYVTDQSLDDLVDASFDEDDELAADDDFENAILIRLADSVPGDLATHENPSDIFSRASAWLPEHHWQALESRDLDAGALVSVSRAKEIVERAFEVARLESTLVEDDDVFREITTPGGLQYESDLSVESILRRAVYTGITPGDAARLTAEEIVGVLLRVWHPE